MDYISIPTAIEVIVRTLETDVMTRVEDPYARGQLWSATGILGNIAAELRAGADATRPAAGEPQQDVDEQAAARMLESVRKALGGQVSLHYGKATTGA